MIKQKGSSNLARKMAGGKKRVDNFQWQIEVTNNEEWEELLQQKGLIVIDVYQDWCGPCIAMAGHLKEIKLQLGDDFLHCALAKADEIGQLVKFRGRSEPTWLFVAGGEPITVIKGANAPLIRQTIIYELEQEKKVLEDNIERITIPWNSIEFPSSISPDVEEETGVSVSELMNVIPNDWANKDAILLQGAYTMILNNIREGFSARSLDISNVTEVRLIDDESESIILWIPSGIQEESEWIENLINDAIQNLEQTEILETSTEENGGQDDVIVEPTDAAEPSEPPTIPTIQFRLLFDLEEKEALVNRCQTEAVTDEVNNCEEIVNGEQQNLEDNEVVDPPAVNDDAEAQKIIQTE